MTENHKPGEGTPFDQAVGRQQPPLKPGIHADVPAATYHADPCPEPSLSGGIAHKLISRSPLHAKAAHPRLNPEYQEQEGAHLDFGSAAHALLLEGLDICQIIEHDDWRTKAAKEARDDARASSLIPLLRKDYERMCTLTEAVKAQTAALDAHPRPLVDGKPEQTLIWKEGGVWCRARIDWLHDDGDVVDDVKTTGTSANPYEWSRNRLFADGKDIQAAFYLRGLRALTGIDATWRFVVVEVEPPYALSVISLAAPAVELAERKVDRAIELWKRCTESGEWPGYSPSVTYAEPPAWEEERFIRAHFEEEPAAA